MTAKNKRTRSANPHPGPGNKTNPGHNPGPFAWLERREMAWKTVFFRLSRRQQASATVKPPSCTSQGPSIQPLSWRLSCPLTSPAVRGLPRGRTRSANDPGYRSGRQEWTKAPCTSKPGAPSAKDPKCTGNVRKIKKTCSAPACHSVPAPAKRLGVCRIRNSLPMARDPATSQRACRA